MSTFLELFGTSASAENDGVEVRYDNETWFRTRRAGGHNNRFDLAMEKHTRAHRALIKAGKLSNDLAKEIQHRCVAETLLVDWGLKLPDAEGNDVSVPFSVEKAIELFDMSPDFYNAVWEAANDARLFKESADLKADAGNS